RLADNIERSVGRQLLYKVGQVLKRTFAQRGVLKSKDICAIGFCDVVPGLCSRKVAERTVRGRSSAMKEKKTGAPWFNRFRVPELKSVVEPEQPDPVIELFVLKGFCKYFNALAYFFLRKDLQR